MLTRRSLLALAGTGFAHSARAEASSLLEQREIAVPKAGPFGKRCLLLRPRRVAASTPLPLLVLLHGLGETNEEQLGIHAWADRYGLLDAYERLPPELSDLAIVCPFTPKPLPSSAGQLDSYALYLETRLLPALRSAAPLLEGPAHLGLDGVSLGGYVAIELFLRKPELFGVIGTLQGAFSLALAESYAPRLAKALSRVGPRAIHVATSTYDPFRAAAERLAKRLEERAIPATLSVLPGPHSQVFLREVGALETLRFQAGALRGNV